MSETTTEAPEPEKKPGEFKPWDKPVQDSPPVSAEPNPVRRTTEEGDVEDADPDSEPQPEPDQGDYPRPEKGTTDTMAPPE